jgi:hypothetical protein
VLLTATVARNLRPDAFSLQDCISCLVSDLDPGLLAGADAMAKPVPCGTSPELHQLEHTRSSPSHLCRFYWHELMLWPDQFPAGGVTVAVSDLDTLVPIDLILVRNGRRSEPLGRRVAQPQSTGAPSTVEFECRATT